MVDSTITTPGKHVFKKKSHETLKAQLNVVESELGKNLLSKEKSEAALRSSLDELKVQHPKEYAEYLAALRIGKHHIDIAPNPNAIEYSPQELERIRDAISEGKSLSNDLNAKISSDLNLKKYPSPVIFFPEIYERIYKKKETPMLYKLSTMTRPSAIKIDFANMSYVIKALEATPEAEISHKAGKLGIGPEQFTSLKDHLTEEFIDGTPLLQLDKKTCTPEYMKKLGVEFGQALKTLHDNNILCNDQLLANDFGKSHTIIDNKGKIRFIDFGASVDLSHFPDFSDDEIHSLLRTDPFALFGFSGLDFMPEGAEKEKALANALNFYRKNILVNYETKEDLIRAKDFQLLCEGLNFLGHRLPNVGAFSEGVNEVIKL